MGQTTLKPAEETKPAEPWIWALLTSRAVRRQFSVALSHPVRASV